MIPSFRDYQMNLHFLIIGPQNDFANPTGHNVVPALAEILTEWENTFAVVDYVMEAGRLCSGCHC